MQESKRYRMHPMDKERITSWLEQLLQSPSGGITAIQTLRNAIMAASVLASAALVALMGVLAAASTNRLESIIGAILFLLASCFYSIRTIWLFASLSFHLQQHDQKTSETARAIISALNALRASAVLLTLALLTAAVGIILR